MSDMNIRESINNKVEDYAVRYQTGKDLWSGKSLGFETEGVETEFRESFEQGGGDIEDVEPDPIKEEQDTEIVETDWDSMECPQDTLDFCDQNL